MCHRRRGRRRSAAGLCVDSSKETFCTTLHGEKGKDEPLESLTRAHGDGGGRQLSGLLTGVARTAEQGSSALATAPRRGTADEGAELGFLCGCGGLNTLISEPWGQAPGDVAGVVRGGSPAGTGHAGKATCPSCWIYPTVGRRPRVPLRGGLQLEKTRPHWAGLG